MSTRATVRPLLLASLTWFALPSELAAQVSDPPPDLSPAEDAVVVVRVKGVDAETNVPKEVQGTGFFISTEGYLVTSNHLLSKLGDVHQGTVWWEVQFGANSTDRVSASVLFPMPNVDLMVLYAAIGSRKVHALARGTRDGVVAGVTTLYTFGYPSGWMYSTRRGSIMAFGAVEPIPVWSTDMTFKNGQSGSPICRGDLRVIAVARGDDADANGIGVVVSVRPIPENYWDRK